MRPFLPAAMSVVLRGWDVLRDGYYWENMGSIESGWVILREGGYYHDENITSKGC